MLTRSLLASGIRKRYHQVDPSRLQLKETIDAYLDDLDANLERGSGLVIVGPPGVGKTFTLSYLYQRLWWGHRQRLRTKYVFSPTLFRKIHDKDDISEYEKADMLLLDDFGREYRADWLFSRFEELVEAKYANMQPMIITANLTVEQMEDNTIGRIIDRWREGGRLLQISGESMRRSLQEHGRGYV